MDARLDLNSIDQFYTKFNERRYFIIEILYFCFEKTIETLASIIVKYIIKKVIESIKNYKTSKINNQAFVKPWHIFDYDKSDVIVNKNYVYIILVMNIALKNNELNPATNIKSITFAYNFQKDCYIIEITIKKQIDCLN